MQISRLWLLNFRNYANTTLEFAEQNLLVGLNGAGKTNVLEALDILATSRSRIVKGLNKCIRYGQPGFVLSGQFTASAKFSVVFRQERSAARTIKVNDETLARTSELLGRVNSVIFLPDDLELIQGAPAARRKYLDIIISQTEQDYYRDLQGYARALKQRNELLKNIRQQITAADALEPWDIQLAEAAVRIRLKRAEYLAFLGAETARLYESMGFFGRLALQYKTSATADRAQNLRLLAESRAEDVRFGSTHFGTHTDDFVFYLDENKAAEFCSQGQRRLIAIALKCAEAKLKAAKLNDPPIVLVDDVLLELDLARLHKIISAIAPGSQKIFTVTDTSRFSQEILRELKIMELAGGKLLG